MTIEPKKKLIRICDGATIRVMAVADGYAMVRFPGCVPFVQRVKDMQGAYKELTT